MKYILLVCDGMADVPDRDGKTPLSVARHPAMDYLAQHGRCGFLDFSYPKGAVDSDIGYLKLLGAFGDNYPGRGYLEALGDGVECGYGDVCIRANFATLDARGMLVDRRAGRDENGLDELAAALDGMKIDNIAFAVRKSTGHRLVIVMRGQGLSHQIKPNDPKIVGVAVPQVRPKKPGAKKTAAALNKFLYRANKILKGHPANKKRGFPANCILIRNAGRRTDAEPFSAMYGISGCCIGGVNIVAGVAKFLGMRFIRPDGATADQRTNLESKVNATLNALARYDFVMLHVNGFDALSHDHKPDGKAQFIEEFDERVVKKILDNVDIGQVVVVMTSDHRTISYPVKKYEHSAEPVPVVICGGGIEPDKAERFDELAVQRGSLRLKNNELLPAVFRLSKSQSKSLFQRLREQ